MKLLSAAYTTFFEKTADSTGALGILGVLHRGGRRPAGAGFAPARRGRNVPVCLEGLESCHFLTGCVALV